ncbi:hypothetical protein D3C71_1888920 [compost metagenome]
MDKAHPLLLSVKRLRIGFEQLRQRNVWLNRRYSGAALGKRNGEPTRGRPDIQHRHSVELDALPFDPPDNPLAPVSSRVTEHFPVEHLRLVVEAAGHINPRPLHPIGHAVRVFLPRLLPYLFIK